MAKTSKKNQKLYIKMQSISVFFDMSKVADSQLKNANTSRR